MKRELSLTIDTIKCFLSSMGPCSIGQIINECQAQAYVGKVPQALSILIKAGTIKYDAAADVYEVTP